MTTASCIALRAAVMLGIAAVLPMAGCSSEPSPPPVAIAGRSCPQWVEFPADRHSNANSAYLGCVSAANLRAMVADPADLERGRQLGPANGERETRAIEAYQLGKVKPFSGGDSTGPLIVVPSTGGSGPP